MAFEHAVWQQLKSKTADDLISALQKDNWTEEERRKNTRAFVKYTVNGAGKKRVVIHYHPKKTYRQGLLKALLGTIGWTEEDMRRLKLIK